MTESPIWRESLLRSAVSRLGRRELNDNIGGATRGSRTWAVGGEMDLFHGAVFVECMDSKREANNNRIQSENSRGWRAGARCRLVREQHGQRLDTLAGATRRQEGRLYGRVAFQI